MIQLVFTAANKGCSLCWPCLCLLICHPWVIGLKLARSCWHCVQHFAPRLLYPLNEVGALGRHPTGQKYRGCPVLWFSDVHGSQMFHDSATFGVGRHSRRAACGVTQNRGGHGGTGSWTRATCDRRVHTFACALESQEEGLQHGAQNSDHC